MVRVLVLFVCISRFVRLRQNLNNDVFSQRIARGVWYRFHSQGEQCTRFKKALSTKRKRVFDRCCVGFDSNNLVRGAIELRPGPNLDSSLSLVELQNNAEAANTKRFRPISPRSDLWGSICVTDEFLLHALFRGGHFLLQPVELPRKFTFRKKLLTSGMDSSYSLTCLETIPFFSTS